MDENPDLLKQQQIVFIDYYTFELYDRLYETVVKSFIEMTDRNIDMNIQVSSYYNAGLRFMNMWLMFMDKMGIKTQEFIDAEKIKEAKEIVDLENKYREEKRESDV